MEQGTSPRRHLASAPWIGFLKQLPRVRLLLGLLFACSPMLEAADSIPSPDSTNQPVASPMAPAVQDPSSKTDQGLSQADAVSPETTEKKDPLTPENANLNLASDLELETLDTREKVFLPAGTYRQILQIPIDSPTMQSAQKMRQERRPEVKVAEPLSPVAGIQKKPLWIRYESLEKIRINEEERRGGLDVPVHGPADLKVRLWYAKSETADTASSVFYFIFGGLGYSTANLLGWSAGNTREIPGDFEYRLIRR